MSDPYSAIEATPQQQAAYAEQSTETTQDAIVRLAKLHPLEYEKVREVEAKKLDIKRVSELDKAVSKARKQNAEDKTPFPDTEPWHEPITPALLLDEISATIRRFIVVDCMSSKQFGQMIA